MTPQEVIDHAEMALETIEAKNEAEGGCAGCDEKAKNFYRSVIECAKKAMIADKLMETLEDADVQAFLRSIRRAKQ